MTDNRSKYSLDARLDLNHLHCKRAISTDREILAMGYRRYRLDGLVHLAVHKAKVVQFLIVPRPISAHVFHISASVVDVSDPATAALQDDQQAPEQDIQKDMKRATSENLLPSRVLRTSCLIARIHQEFLSSHTSSGRGSMSTLTVGGLGTPIFGISCIAMPNGIFGSDMA